MRAKTLVLFDFVLFLIFFSGSALILYREVYSEVVEYTPTGKVLISEIRPSGGTGKANDEFIELYNPGANPIILGGWRLGRLTKNASSSEAQLLFTFPPGTVLPTHTHILVAHAEYVGAVPPDYLYTGQGLSDDNTLVLTDLQEQVIDLVGYGLAKNYETAPAEAPTAQLLSLERRAGGDLGNDQDTNNNQVDFFRARSSPQNLQSLPTPAAALVSVEETITTTTVITTTTLIPETSVSSTLATTTPEIEIAIPALVVTTTVITTSTDQISGEAVQSTSSSTANYVIGMALINELYPIPESGQTEFVEVVNNSAADINFSGWFLTDGSGAKSPLTGILLAEDYLIIEKPKGSLNNSGDVVSLVAPNGLVIDRAVYGDWDDGDLNDNAPTPETGMSLVRIGSGQDDKTNFGLSKMVTKGAENIYTPNQIKVFEDEQDSPTVITTKATSTEKIKVVAKKTEPIYPRIVYPATVLVGEEVVLDASLSTGGQGQRQYIWETDDGLVLRGEIITHRYKEEDVYSVVLTVFDDTGIEKHKTIKIRVLPNPALEVQEKTVVRQVATVSAKSVAKKPEPESLYVSINELTKVKTNSAVRTRGILAAVLLNKSVPEFYLIGEPGVGGAATGILVKTKSNNLDARIGDLVEITGKFITNATSGNYIQYSAKDQASILKNNELVVPVSSTVKSIEQLSGGFVQLTGKVVEKTNTYTTVADDTGEIKVLGNLEDFKKEDQVIVIGYLVRLKEGVVIKPAASSDVVKVAINVKAFEEGISPKNNPKKSLLVIVLGFLVVIGLGIKKLWFNHKKEIIEGTEI